MLQLRESLDAEAAAMGCTIIRVDAVHPTSFWDNSLHAFTSMNAAIMRMLIRLQL